MDGQKKYAAPKKNLGVFILVKMLKYLYLVQYRRYDQYMSHPFIGTNARWLVSVGKKENLVS